MSPRQRAIEREVRKVAESGEDVTYKVAPNRADNAAKVPHSVRLQAEGSNGYLLDFTLQNKDLPLLSDQIKAGNMPKNEHGFRFGTRA